MPNDACPWKGLTCQSVDRVTVMETDNYETLVREPQKAKLTPRLEDYGREMATQGLKPVRIRNEMARRFGLAEAEIPILRQVQWLVSSYSKKNMHRNDDHDEILDQIDQLPYDVGNGSDEKSCLVKLTTKRLLLNAARDPESFIFRMDAIFKLNQRLEDIYVLALTELRRVFASVSSWQMVVKFVVVDAKAAQQNAVAQGFGVDPESFAPMPRTTH
ncbi:hypothetical protein F441_09840 [Phytophthora nicotianae CJ01A1]|uniref:MULE transposase domain-containing protein n=1 Tax=Phytophthora nicotianae CJ01A1 TaxID=1317063 RepID=W2WYY0_PHYNI|nr:hypothetical protein F441_09840 [Phytophthora nicotianae CJ01A1]